MSVAVRNWIEPMLRAWGMQKRRALSGMRRFSDGTVRADGWAPFSYTSQAFQGGSTGGSESHGQHFAEVFTGDALRIWRALAEAPEEIREIAFEHYVAAGNAVHKSQRPGVSIRRYWQRLENASYYLAGSLDRARPPAPSGSGSPEP